MPIVYTHKQTHWRSKGSPHGYLIMGQPSTLTKLPGASPQKLQVLKSSEDHAKKKIVVLVVHIKVLSLLTSTDVLLPDWFPVQVCLMYCLNCCRLSSTACRSSSPPLAAPLIQPSPGIDLSSSTQERSLARLARTC